ncbi:AKAP7-like phosphoesterase domain-containing protein [Oscillatoria salina]|uniref:DUF1868 domain-containing protein n=1 Tax=Oscillatoria salina TaxID=331517 RepID=UPI0013B801A6|nr:DUF1868 domain-containing protein [Oscillatoria salina]MBZ8179966.1 DUF1868 domain-containing protein [Oscillatoria salina IIICB1]NET86809.1 DUF1868 domain-containing protein [Kamptonema sp. SIO1D9]
MDEAYQTYLNRVARLTLPSAYSGQLQNIQESPKFCGEQPVDFPGYTVMTPPWCEDEYNRDIYGNLKVVQSQLHEQLDSGSIATVPPESFHLTLADLIWDSAYRDALKENPNFERELRDCIAESFQQSQELVSLGKPIELRLLGLTVRPRAIAVCFIPVDEAGYTRILQLRRSIYQNPGLIGLGVEQQYTFMGHITLGYFGTIPADLDRDRLQQILTSLNDQLLEAEAQILTVRRAELRKFANMTGYYRDSDLPAIEF